MRRYQKKRVFARNLADLKSTISKERFLLRKQDLWMFLNEATNNTGFDRHYVYHTAWAARKIRETEPDLHTDIGSSLYFSALVSAFSPISFYDYRPAKLGLSNLGSAHADLLNLNMQDNSVPSLSCMHVVEHIGLGRYGDPIDYDGDLKAISELKRVLQPDGNLFFVVHMGKVARIQFNAHRIYTYDQISEYFSDLELKEFSFIENETDNPIQLNYDPSLIDEMYGCGCFWFKKRQTG